MAKRLIVNADDYGRSPEISEGIRLAHKYGIVTSSTCMMNISTTADDVRRAVEETPSLGLGVHLVLTMGKPLSAREAVLSVVDEEGNFFKYTPFIGNLPDLNVEEVRAEWRLQIERFIEAAGHKPTHLDSHHHSSFFLPELFRAMLDLAKEYDCGIRYPFNDDIWPELEETARQVPGLMEYFSPRRPDRFIADFYDDRATYDELMKIMDNLEEETSELMCHPGFVPDSFVSESIYNKQRQRELGILLDPAIRYAVIAKDVELISFANL